MKRIIVLVVLFGAIVLGLWLKRYSEKHNPEYRFAKIYETNEWGQSGPGSDPLNSKIYLQILQKFFNDPRFHTIVDLGSGDWRLMETITIPNEKIYKGFDIVKSVIDHANNKYKKPNVQFFHIHSLEEFRNEKADLLIVKDVMHHWPNKTIQYFIANILPNFKYALITNDFTNNEPNIDIKAGHFRPINIEAEPFNMKNIEVIDTYQSHGIIKRVYLYTNPEAN